MKNETKKLLEDIYNVLGYSSSIGFTVVLSWLIYMIHKHGSVILIEKNIYIRLAEIGLGGITISFLLSKLIKTYKNIEK